MAEITITFLDANEVVKIPVSALQHLKSGGEGRIYTFTHKDVKYILKALPDNQEIFERMKLIRETLLAKKVHIPPSIKHAGLHVAQGFCSPSTLNFRMAQGVYLLVFHYVPGKTFDAEMGDKLISLNAGDSFATFKADFPRRLSIARKTAEVLYEIQKAGIVHGDIFFDNFMLSTSGEVFAIDFGGAGLYDRLKGQWLRKATIAGKFDALGFPKPFEMVALNEPTLYTDRWAGVLLIWWILTGTRHPYWMLKRVDAQPLKLLSENAAAATNNTWPPRVTLAPAQFKFLYDDFPYTTYTEFMNTLFGVNSSFGRLLFNNFIHGYQKPLNRPDFKQIKESLLLIKS